MSKVTQNPSQSHSTKQRTKPQANDPTMVTISYAGDQKETQVEFCPFNPLWCILIVQSCAPEI